MLESIDPKKSLLCMAFAACLSHAVEFSTKVVYSLDTPGEPKTLTLTNNLSSGGTIDSVTVLPHTFLSHVAYKEVYNGSTSGWFAMGHGDPVLNKQIGFHKTIPPGGSYVMTSFADFRNFGILKGAAGALEARVASVTPVSVIFHLSGKTDTVSMYLTPVTSSLGKPIGRAETRDRGGMNVVDAKGRALKDWRFAIPLP